MLSPEYVALKDGLKPPEATVPQVKGCFRADFVNKFTEPIVKRANETRLRQNFGVFSDCKPGQRIRTKRSAIAEMAKK